MKTVIDWIKSNPFITACGVIAFVGLVGMGYLRFVQASKFTETRSEELKQINTQQKGLMSISVPLPNEDLNAPPINVSTVINNVVINDVNGIYSTIREQYELIRVETSDFNSDRHLPVLLGRGDIWPDAGSQRQDLYVQAAVDYLNHFKAVFNYGQPNSWNMPAMRASSPPTAQQVEQVLAETAFNFVNSIGVSSAAMLTEQQAEQLYSEQRVELMNLLADRARSIHLYADLPAEEDPFYVEPDDEQPTTSSVFGGGGTSTSRSDREADNGLPAGYPFQIADWAFAETPPNPDQLWEGQVQLWVMRDIMQAIANLNRVEEGVEVTQPDGTTTTVPATALNSPIKRLLRLETLPGYVGLHSIGGAFDIRSDDNGRSGTRSGASRGFDTPIRSRSGDGEAVYPDPPLERQPKKQTERADDHFGISPTGRVSNAVYDVRHTRLVIDIQWDKLPAFMEELREMNFLTVISADIQDVDEYEMLREGYVYGESDVVRADLLIESLWFREWTGELMPKIIREKLLIEIPEGRTESSAPTDMPY